MSRFGVGVDDAGHAPDELRRRSVGGVRPIRPAGGHGRGLPGVGVSVALIGDGEPLGDIRLERDEGTPGELLQLP